MTPEPMPPPISICTTAGPSAAAIGSGVPGVDEDRTGVVAPADSLRSRTTSATAPAMATATTAAITMRPLRATARGRG